MSSGSSGDWPPTATTTGAETTVSASASAASVSSWVISGATASVSSGIGPSVTSQPARTASAAASVTSDAPSLAGVAVGAPSTNWTVPSTGSTSRLPWRASTWASNASWSTATTGGFSAPPTRCSHRRVGLIENDVSSSAVAAASSVSPAAAGSSVVVASPAVSVTGSAARDRRPARHLVREVPLRARVQAADHEHADAGPQQAAGPAPARRVLLEAVERRRDALLVRRDGAERPRDDRGRDRVAAGGTRDGASRDRARRDRGPLPRRDGGQHLGPVARRVRGRGRHGREDARRRVVAGRGGGLPDARGGVGRGRDVRGGLRPGRLPRARGRLRRRRGLARRRRGLAGRCGGLARRGDGLGGRREGGTGRRGGAVDRLVDGVGR